MVYTKCARVPTNPVHLNNWYNKYRRCLPKWWMHSFNSSHFMSWNEKMVYLIEDSIFFRQYYIASTFYCTSSTTLFSVFLDIVDQIWTVQSPVLCQYSIASVIGIEDNFSILLNFIEDASFHSRLFEDFIPFEKFVIL